MWVWVATGLAFYTLSTVLAALFLVARPRRPSRRPAITIFKPIAGSIRYEDLRSFFDQRYDAVQIVLGLQGRAGEVVDRVCAEFPDRDVAIVPCDGAGPNFKTANLAQMMSAAKHDLWVVTDADVRADPGFLDRVAAAFEDERVGAATALCMIEARTLPAALQAYVWSLDKLAFLPLAKLVGALRFGNGCATAVRRSIVEEAGGFEAFSDRIGDGYWWPHLAWKAGRTVAILDRALLLTDPPRDWGSMARLQVRYAREQRVLEPVGNFLIPLTWGWIASLAFGSIELTASLLSIRMMLPLLASFAHRESRMLRWIWLMPFRDVWSAIVWVAGYAGRTVTWRDREFELRQGGILKSVK